MKTPRNPFVLGHIIERPYFCDRFEEQKKMISAIINGRNIVLISPRRMGKTSLVYVSMNDSKEIEEEYITFFFDILQTNSLSEFTYMLGKTIFDTLRSKEETRVRGFLAALKSLRGSFGFDPITGSPTFDIQLGDIKRPEYTLEEIFNYLENNDKPIIIVIDEFQQITKYPEKNVEAILRSHIQRLRNASFIFAGSEQTILQEMFVSSKRPFYNSAEIMHLGAIPEEQYVGFAKHLFEERDKSVEEDPIKWAFRLFDGNTFYLQRTMNGSFAETPKGKTCGKETVRRTVKAMLAANEVMYREILSNVNLSQKATLIAIAKDRIARNPMSGEFIKRHSLKSASAVQSALLKLTKSGFIYKSDSGYYLTDPLMRIFINELYSTSELKEY